MVVVVARTAEEARLLAADDEGRAGAGDPLRMAGEPMRRSDDPPPMTCGLAGRLLELNRAAVTCGD